VLLGFRLFTRLVLFSSLSPNMNRFGVLPHNVIFFWVAAVTMPFRMVLLFYSFILPPAGADVAGVQTLSRSKPGGLLILIFLVAWLWMPLSVSWAEQPLSISPAVVKPGDNITVTGAGFQSGVRGMVWGGGPYITGSVATPGYAFEVAVSGGLAYVAGVNGLQVIDASNPAAPVVVGSVATPGRALEVAVSGGLAYVAAVGGLQVIDVSNPAAPVIVGSVATPAAAGVAVSGGLAYVVGGAYSGLQIIDVSHPASPVVVGSVATGGNAEGVAVSGGLAYVANGLGLQVIDVSNPAAPEMVGFVITPGGSTGVAVSGGLAYVGGGNSNGPLQVIDVSNPAALEIVGFVTSPGGARGVAVSGGLAYVVGGNSDGPLQVIDVSNPVAPVVVGRVVTPVGARRVAVSGGLAYVVGGSYGRLQVIDVSNPATPMLVGSVVTWGGTPGVAVSGELAYVADGGLKVIDVRHPDAPRLVGSVGTPEGAYGVAVSGELAYVADGIGLQVIDVSHPAAPVLVGSVATPGEAYGVAVSGGLAYVAAVGGLQVIDVSHPASPVLVGSVAAGGYSSGVAVSGGLVYMAEGDYPYSGLRVISAIVNSVTTRQDSSTLTMSVPAHLPPGIYDVTVVNPDGTVYKARNALTIADASVAALDRDRDGILDITDNCPNVPNTSQADGNGNGRGDICDFGQAAIAPVALTVNNASGLYVRQGPGTGYAIVNDLTDGQTFIAFERKDQNGDRWYRIHLPCDSTGWCAGWVAGRSHGVQYSAETPAITQAAVVNTFAQGLNIRFSPGGSVRDGAYDGQRFAVRDSAPSGLGCRQRWYRIDTPLSSGTQAGWMCGEFLQLSGNLPPASVSLSGLISGPAALDRQTVKVALTGRASANTTPDGSGNFSFSALADGNYTITPSAPGWQFDPPSQTVSVAGASLGGLDFRVCRTGNAFSGTLRDINGNPVHNARISIGGITVTPDVNGHYTVTGLPCGEYPIKVIPVNGATFSPYIGKVDSFDMQGSVSSGWNVDLPLADESTSYTLDGQTGVGGDPVNTATGNYVYQHRDLSIPGIGMPFSFERSYNSRDDRNGPLGYNWTHNWNIHLDAATDKVVVRWGDGRTQSWAPDGAGGFITQLGTFDTLVDDGSGGYTLKLRSKREYRFDSAGRLVSVSNRNGNRIQLAYEGGGLSQIIDSAGRTIIFSHDSNGRIMQITDPIGRTTRFGYDANGDLVSATDTNGNITRYSYDDSHQILTIVDPLGNILVSNTYDAQKRVVTYQTDAKGGKTTYQYDSETFKTTFTDALGNVQVHYHDSLLRLIREEDSNGGVKQYEYDAAGNRSQVTDANGNVTTYKYDVNGNVISKSDALGNVTTITYDANSNPLTRTDALGNTTTFVYDANGNLIQTTDALGNVNSVSYDSRGLPVVISDARGNATVNNYDAQGNLVSVKDALGHTIRYTYDGVGRKLTRVDALGRTTSYRYDDNNNLLSITDPLGNEITHTYDANDNRISTRDGKGNLTTFDYDEKDLLISTTDALGNTVTHGYDALDRRIASTDARGNTSRFVFDANGNLVKTTDAAGNISKYTYDANGNRLSATNAEGRTVLYQYDALNRRIETHDALGNTTTIVYDKLGRVASNTNANGQTTHFGYDAIGRLIEVTDAAGGIVEYGYDENGNRIFMDDPNGNTTTYSYDALNRLVSKTEALGNTTRYQYDAVGNLTQLTRPDGDVISYSYDGLDRLIGIDYPDGSSFSLSYDANGNRIQLVDNLGTQTFAYDALDRMTSHTDPFGNTVDYRYDANGNRTGLTYPDGKTVNYGYDVRNLLVSVTDWRGNTTSYTYDATGRLKENSLPNGTTTSYAYDNADRLIHLSNQTTDGSLISSYAYVLDALGNPVQEDREDPLPANLTPGTTAYNYDEENRLIDANGVMNSFDDNGNLTVKGGNSYIYDYENRLMEMTNGGTVTLYQYDALGNRYSRTRSGNTTRYVLDVNTSLTNVLAETDSSNNITAYNLYGLGLIARIQPDGTASYYHYDSRGSTIALTDDSANITDTYVYDPFGKPVNRSGSTNNPFTYLGRYGVLDEGDKLFYMRARYYDSEQQRFVGKDSKPGEDQSSQSMNRYAYAMNSPVRLIDISGFSPNEAIELNSELLAGSSDRNNNGVLNSPQQLPINALQEVTKVKEVRIYTEEETLELLRIAVDQLAETSNNLEAALLIWQFVATHEGGTAVFDFGYQPMYQDAKFKVDGETISAYQFGNYFAGYVSTYQFGIPGYYTARFGGNMFSIAQNHTWDNPDSIKWIKKGSVDALGSKQSRSW